MKISELIDFLEQKYLKLGDVQLFAEDDDGRSTSAVPVNPRIAYRNIWKGHSAGKKHFLDII